MRIRVVFLHLLFLSLHLVLVVYLLLLLHPWLLLLYLLRPWPLFPSQVDDVVRVPQTHVDREVLRMFGCCFHCHLDTGVGEPNFGTSVVEMSDDDHQSDGEGTRPLSPVALTPPVHIVIRRSQHRSPLQKSTYNCARNYVDSPTYEPYVLPPPKLCPHCNAKLFPFESSALCCKKGQICLPYRPPPADLLSFGPAQPHINNG